MQHIQRKTECTYSLVRKPEKKQQLGRTSNAWEDIKMDLKAKGCEGMDEDYPDGK